MSPLLLYGGGSVKKVKINWIKILSVLCIICITFLTISSSFAMAASGSPVSWDDVSDDAIAVRDAYFEYFSSLGKNFLSPSITDPTDIPLSWAKFIQDLGWCISPVDDIYYYLKDGVLCVRSSGGGGHVRSGVRGSGGYCRNCKKSAAECTCNNFDGTASEFYPFFSGKDIKNTAADYNSRYMPMDNPEQFIWSYNSDNSVTKTKQDRSQRFYFFPQVPVYAGSSGTWGNQKWTDFYLIGFAIDDISGVYYGKYYVHVYTKNENGSVSLITDYYSLSDGSLYQTKKGTWDIGNYPYLSMHYATGSSMFSFRGYKSASAYYGDVTSSWKTIVTSNVAMPLSASDNSSTLEFTKYVALPSFTPDTNKSDDYGFICSSKPFELFANQTGIDFQKIPDNYIITINGDTIYNYPITDPSTGNSSTINNLIINNYIIPGYPEAPDPDGPITSGLYGVKVSGNVKVDGDINIKADPIQIKTDPIDINVNVNQGGGSVGSAGTGEVIRFDQDIGLNNYYDWMQEQTTGFSGFMKNFFGWLPGDIVIMLCAGFGLVILARFLGR